MKKKLIYISGPVDGVNNPDLVFGQAEEELISRGYKDNINPLVIGEFLPDDRETILKVDLALVGACDAIYMLRGWEDSRGANREYGCAIGKGLEIIYQEQKPK